MSLIILATAVSMDLYYNTIDLTKTAIPVIAVILGVKQGGVIVKDLMRNKNNTKDSNLQIGEDDAEF